MCRIRSETIGERHIESRLKRIYRRITRTKTANRKLQIADGDKRQAICAFYLFCRKLAPGVIARPKGPWQSLFIKQRKLPKHLRLLRSALRQAQDFARNDVYHHAIFYIALSILTSGGISRILRWQIYYQVRIVTSRNGLCSRAW